MTRLRRTSREIVPGERSSIRAIMRLAVPLASSIAISSRSLKVRYLPVGTGAASYPASCANPVSCNKPAWTRDAQGHQTDFVYSPTHGGVLTATGPAPAPGGIRPQVRVSYGAVGPVTMPIAVSRCQTTASCVGTPDEFRRTVAYTANLVPSSVTEASADGALSATTGYGYDIFGNLLTADGPLPGSVDTTRYRYDGARQLVGVVGPDPDGPGPRIPLARRFTYNNDGQVTLAETGTVTDQSDAAWAAFSPA